MKNIKDFIIMLLIIMPLTFVLLFFGYYPVQFQLVLHTNNVSGEGICQTYVCPLQGFAAFYKIEFYFGSELKKATLGDFHLKNIRQAIIKEELIPILKVFTLLILIQLTFFQMVRKSKEIKQNYHHMMVYCM